jgi:hypothetical protein
MRRVRAEIATELREFGLVATEKLIDRVRDETGRKYRA